MARQTQSDYDSAADGVAGSGAVDASLETPAKSWRPGIAFSGLMAAILLLVVLLWMDVRHRSAPPGLVSWTKIPNTNPANSPPTAVPAPEATPPAPPCFTDSPLVEAEARLLAELASDDRGDLWIARQHSARLLCVE